MLPCYFSVFHFRFLNVDSTLPVDSSLGPCPHLNAADSSELGVFLEDEYEWEEDDDEDDFDFEEDY